MRRMAATLVLVTMLACSGEDEGNQYSDQVRSNFLSSCESSSGGQEDTCECVLDEIEERMSEDEFLELEQKMIDEGQQALTSDDAIQESFEECGLDV